MMKIQMFNQIFNYLASEVLDNYLGTKKEPDSHKITHLDELEEILNQAKGIDLNLLKLKGQVEEVRAEEWDYENGLKYIICEFDYCKKNGEKGTLEKRILTADFLTNPIMMLDFSRKRVALEQLLASSSTPVNLFPEEKRNIEIKEMSVSLNGLCVGCFKEIKNLKTKQLLKEEYIPYYSVITEDKMVKDFIQFCGCGDNSLEILYDNSKPIYAQFSKNRSVEMIGFSSTNEEDIQKMVSFIHQEVEAIIQKISSNIKIYGRAGDVKKKTRKIES